jgi:hypothetical protein
MLRLDADWALVAWGAAIGVMVAFLALGFILPIRWAEHALVSEYELLRTFNGARGWTLAQGQ